MAVPEIDIENSKTLTQISYGAFGKIFLCQDHYGNNFVSKEISDKKSFAKEVKFYQKLQENCNYFPEFYNYYVGMKYNCIFLQCCQRDLRYMLDKGEKIDYHSFILHMSEALDILKEKEIIHCDLKPGNILYDEKSDLFKICDFGISCHKQDKKYFPVQSVYYRSPEVIARHTYGHAIDVWSIGCIFYEVMYQKILFQHLNELECFYLMMVRLGMPSKRQFPEIYNGNIIYRDKRPVLTNCPNSPEMVIYFEPLKVASDSYGSIIRKCLRWNPRKRITPSGIIKILNQSEI